MGFLMEFQPGMAAETGSQARVVFDLGVEPAALVGGMSWIVGAFPFDFVEKLTGEVLNDGVWIEIFAAGGVGFRGTGY